MKQIQLLTLASLVTLLCACSGGGNRKTVGQQCPGGDFQPVAKTIGANQQQVDLKGTDMSGIPAGVYTYTGARLYYVDQSDLRMEVVETKDNRGNFKTVFGCVRNARKPLTAPVSVESVTDMTVSADHKVVANVTQFNIAFVDGKLKPVSEKQTKTVNAPSETITDRTTQYFFIKTDRNDADFEIRAFGADDHGTYSLSVTFKRANLP